MDEPNYSETVRQLVLNAENGDPSAARFLLEEFVNHRSLYVHEGLTKADQHVLEFMVRATREILGGVAPVKAFCLSSGEPGQPHKRTEMRDIILALHVLKEAESLKSSEAPPITTAQKRIAIRSGFSASLIRRAWDDIGGSEGAIQIRNEFYPDGIPTLPMLKK